MTLTKNIFLFISISLICSFAQAQDFEVLEVNTKNTRAQITNRGLLNAGDTLSFTDKFAETCNAHVVSAKDDTAVLDISSCENAKSVVAKTVFTKTNSTQTKAEPPAQATPQPKPQSGPTIDEDWYTLWGLGITGVNYGEKQVNDAFDAADKQPGVTRNSFNYDFFGFYWPTIDKKAMQGFVINAILDRLEAAGDTIDIIQYQYSYSYHRFYGANIGDGWFWRGDIGLVKYRLDIKTTLISYTDDSKAGVGLLAGGGYGFAMGRETRFLLGAYLSYHEAEHDHITNLSVSGGFLF